MKEQKKKQLRKNDIIIEKKQILQGFEFLSADKLEKLSGVKANLLFKWRKVQGTNKKRKGRKIISVGLDTFLIEYITLNRLQKRSITRKQLTEQGKAFVTESKKANMADFNKIKEFYIDITQNLSSGNYDESHVINFDETTITKSQQTNYTVTTKKEKYVQIKQNQNEQSYSLGLGISKNGIKLKQMIVWPSKGIKNIFKTKIPANISIQYRNKKSYSNQELFRIWIETILAPHANSLQNEKKRILIIDNFKGHKLSELQDILEAFRYELIYLPANSMDILQPLDIYVNKSYKQTYRQLIIDSKYDERQLSHGYFIDILSKVWTQIDVSSSWSIYDKSDFLELLKPKFITIVTNEIEIQLQKQTILMKDEQQQQDMLDDIIEDLSNSVYNETQHESGEDRSSQSDNSSQSKSSSESQCPNQPDNNNNSSNYGRSESNSKLSYKISSKCSNNKIK